MPEKVSVPPALIFRDRVRASDTEVVRDIVSSTDFFNSEEVEVAVSLVEEHLRDGDAGGYSFVFAELGGRGLGYTCYGRIPGTRESYDLYWIAVRPNAQGLGIGRRLLVEAEERILSAGGARVYIETSERELYRKTRAFYRHAGYRKAALLEDFYEPGDAKVIYLKVLRPASGRSDGTAPPAHEQ